MGLLRVHSFFGHIYGLALSLLLPMDLYLSCKVLVSPVFQLLGRVVSELAGVSTFGGDVDLVVQVGVERLTAFLQGRASACHFAVSLQKRIVLFWVLV